MKKIVDFMMRLGVVEGMTFRCEVEDGVGPVLTPNPRPTRMQPAAVPEPTRPVRRRQSRASGAWTAKPLHVIW